MWATRRLLLSACSCVCLGATAVEQACYARNCTQTPSASMMQMKSRDMAHSARGMSHSMTLGASSTLSEVSGYTEGTISNAEYEDVYYYSEVAAAEACDADSTCLGYWQGIHGDAGLYVLLRSGSRTWTKGNGHVLSVKVKDSMRSSNQRSAGIVLSFGDGGMEILAAMATSFINNYTLALGTVDAPLPSEGVNIPIPSSTMQGFLDDPNISDGLGDDADSYKLLAQTIEDFAMNITKVGVGNVQIMDLMVASVPPDGLVYSLGVNASIVVEYGLTGKIGNESVNSTGTASGTAGGSIRTNMSFIPRDTIPVLIPNSTISCVADLAFTSHNHSLIDASLANYSDGIEYHVESVFYGFLAQQLDILINMANNHTEGFINATHNFTSDTFNVSINNSMTSIIAEEGHISFGIDADVGDPYSGWCKEPWPEELPRYNEKGYTFEGMSIAVSNRVFNCALQRAFEVGNLQQRLNTSEYLEDWQMKILTVFVHGFDLFGNQPDAYDLIFHALEPPTVNSHPDGKSMIATGNIAVTFKPVEVTDCDKTEARGLTCVTLAGFLTKGLSFEIDLDPTKSVLLLESQGCNIKVEKRGESRKGVAFEILAHILSAVACQRFLTDYLFKQANEALSHIALPVPEEIHQTLVVKFTFHKGYVLSQAHMKDGYIDEQEIPEHVPICEDARDVCYTDHCMGTATNRVPWGEQWVESYVEKPGGCCGWFSSDRRCMTCCRPPMAEEQKEEIKMCTDTVDVCAKDTFGEGACLGTWTNPIPDDEIWPFTGIVKDFGCCTGGMGQCNLCCKPGHVVEEVPPTPSPTRQCADVCSKDLCVGSRTNPIPNGDTWEIVEEETSGSCCAFGLGKCSRCCVFDYPPTPRPPTPPPTRECVNVCHKDQCEGTFSNPIPMGDKWDITVAEATTDGCCFGGFGSCSTCCKPLWGGWVPTPPPVPTPAPPTQSPTLRCLDRVCSKDQCRGTWTNPIPSGETWDIVEADNGKPCCFGGFGVCSTCCEPAEGPVNQTTSAPTPRPTSAPTRHCESVCSRDTCKGTFTNPIPLGDQWEMTDANNGGSCCFGGFGTCDTCCEPPLVPTPPTPPTPPPTDTPTTESDRTCKDVCSKDDCKGTATNPIPWGETWDIVAEDNGNKCCTFNLGKCSTCCEPYPSPEPTPRPTEPTQPPTPRPTVDISNRNCKTNVCHKDMCKGTRTNPLPFNEQWEIIEGNNGGKCCSFGLGKCSTCCEIVPSPAPTPPTPPTPPPTPVPGYTEGTISNAEYEDKVYYSEVAVAAACDADSTCLGYWQGIHGDAGLYVILRSGSRTWAKGNGHVLSVKVKATCSTYTTACPAGTENPGVAKGCGSTCDETTCCEAPRRVQVSGYTEGTISNAEYDDTLYHSEVEVAAACNADSTCLGYWQGIHGDAGLYVILRSGSRTWTKGNGHVLSVKIKATCSTYTTACPDGTINPGVAKGCGPTCDEATCCEDSTPEPATPAPTPVPEPPRRRRQKWWWR